MAYATSPPATQPTAPQKPDHHSVSSPRSTRCPAKGMMISDGSGMHADSIAMRKKTPQYPVAEMTAMTKAATAARIRVTIDSPDRSDHGRHGDRAIGLGNVTLAPLPKTPAASDLCASRRHGLGEDTELEIALADLVNSADEGRCAHVRDLRVLEVDVTDLREGARHRFLEPRVDQILLVGTANE